MRLARYVVVRLWMGNASYSHPSRTDFTSLTRRRAQRFAMRATLGAPPGMWYEAWPIAEFDDRETRHIDMMERSLESDRECARALRATGETE